MKVKIRKFAGRRSVGTSGKRMACEPERGRKYRLTESARRGRGETARGGELGKDRRRPVKKRGK